MKLKDLKTTTTLPVKIKLTEGFTLEESLDVGMIARLDTYRVDGEYSDGTVMEVFVTVLPEDVPYNKSIAKRNWYDKNSNPTLDFFEANSEKKKSDGSYKVVLYVMEDDDFFTVAEDTPNDILKEVYELLDSVEQTSNDVLTDENHKKLCRAIYKVKNLINE